MDLLLAVKASVRSSTSAINQSFKKKKKKLTIQVYLGQHDQLLQD